MGLDFSSAVPVYYQLKELLREDIAGGIYPPGSQLPSEMELMKRFGISRATVRQALSDLERQGVLTKRKGKGTFVAQPKLEEDLSGFYSFKRQMEQQGLEISIRVISRYTLPATQRQMDLLDLPAGSTIFRVLRLISVNDDPVFIESWEIPEKHCPGLLELDLTTPFAKILVDHYKLSMAKVLKYIEPALADDFEAGVLGIKRGQPVLLVERVTYPSASEPALFTTKWIVRGDRCRHLIRLGETDNASPVSGTPGM